MINRGKSLGCSYLSELEIAKNATYSSHRIIDEFLDVLSICVENDILCLISDTPVDGKAGTIKGKLLSVCNQSEISMNKVFGFGSDDASVMTGCRSGVAACLRSQNHEMISIHCGAHRLALASLQAARSIAYLKKFDNHLNTIFYHFANSSVQEAALHQVQTMMEEPVLYLKKAAFTRWLSHDQTVSTIRKTLQSLLATLE